MAKLLSCYYLDDPLTQDERLFVERTLLGPWARFKTGATALVEKRVPVVLSLPDQQGIYQRNPEQRARQIRGNLHHAGIGKDAGRQVIWIMPADPEWDAIFQFAIREHTGFGPFVVQRWYRDEANNIVRSEARVVNTHLLLQGLE